MKSGFFPAAFLALVTALMITQPAVADTEVAKPARVNTVIVQRAAIVEAVNRS